MNNSINFIIDYENCPFTVEILKFLVNLNNNSFPNFLKYIFVLNINLPELLEDHDKRELFKSKPFSEKVFILPLDYQESLYKIVQQVTCTVDYFGDLDEDLFDLNTIVVDSLQMKYGGD